MAKISDTDWYSKWKGFFVEAIQQESQEIVEVSKNLTEAKNKQTPLNKQDQEEIDKLIDKEFAKFEKTLKKQVADFKKKVKKAHES